MKTAVDSAEVCGASLREAAELARAFAADRASAERIAELGAMVASCFEAGGKLLLCGNGGSACDAMHAAEELTSRFRGDRRALPAIACSDAGFITCAANDFGFERVFERFVEALGRPGDVLIVLSTSGRSLNVMRAVVAAQRFGLRTASLLGRDGGDLAGVCEWQMIAPGSTSDRIQELHMLALHTMVECVEHRLGLV